MGNASLAIEIRGADKVYPNGVRALQPIDLRVRDGEVVTLIGPSGCGKSTLLRLVASLTTPSSGSVSIAPSYRSGRVAFVFQHPTLMPWARVDSNVRLPLDLAGVDRRQAQERAARALELVGLRDFHRAYPRELSGGMQMRTSIARALATGPQMLLLDEPFGALDEIARNRLDRDVSSLAARENLTVLFVTHSIYEAVFLSSRVLVMSPRPGRVIDEVVIDAPQPRPDAFRAGEVFATACARLSRSLEVAVEGSLP